MVGAMHGTLDVAQHGVDPPEDWMPFAGRATAGDDRDMRAIGLGDTREAVQSIGYHRRAGDQVALRPCRQHGLAKPDHLIHPHGDGVALTIALDRRHKRRLARAATRPVPPPWRSPPQYASSICTMPPSAKSLSRSTIACISFCLSSHAVLYDTPSCRCIAKAEMPFLC